MSQNTFNPHRLLILNRNYGELIMPMFGPVIRLLNKGLTRALVSLERGGNHPYLLLNQIDEQWAARRRQDHAANTNRYAAWLRRKEHKMRGYKE